jgi:hypothetical protein
MIPIPKINECTTEAIRTNRQGGRILTGILFSNLLCQGYRSTETRLTIAGVRREALSIQSVEFLYVNTRNIVPGDRLLCPPVINGHHTGDRVIAILIFEIPAIPLNILLDCRYFKGINGIYLAWKCLKRALSHSHL